MTSITCNGHEYKLYSSIKELPIGLGKKSGAYLMKDVGIGSSITDVDDHLARLMTLLQSGSKEEALEEAKNLRYNMFSMLSEINYQSLAFGCLIYSIDGAEVKDYSEEHLTAITDQLTGAEVEQHLSEVKKNWILKGA